MAQKQFLHELLKQDQEPFRLKNFISDRRYHLKKPSPATNLHLRKRNPNHILCKHPCFLSFHSSPDVTNSPFSHLPSPAKSPCKSSNGAVFLHIPPKTAALLVEAAMRIKKQQHSKPKSNGGKNIGLGLLGSFLKRLKDRSKTKTRAIGENGFKVSGQAAADGDGQEIVRISCSCSNRRPSSGNWTENNELDFETSPSSFGSECSDEIIYGFCETRFCTSPLKFNLQKSPQSSGRRTPEFCSPPASPTRCVNQENENYRTSNSDSDNVQEEDKKQCSPVSVLDPPFEDDVDVRLSGDANEDDEYDLECSYENIERSKYQLLYKLRRFENLAKLDRLDGDEQLSLYRNMSTDMKKLVSDLIAEEKNEMVSSCGSNAIVMSRICDRLDSWGEVETNTIDMMVGLDLKRAFDGWTRFNEQVEEISAEIEVAILGVLLEELLQ